MAMLVYGLLGAITVIVLLNWLNALIKPSRVPWLSGKQHSRKTAAWRGFAAIVAVGILANVLAPLLKSFPEDAPAHRPAQRVAQPSPEAQVATAEQQIKAQEAAQKAAAEQAATRKKDAAFAECRQQLPNHVKHPSSIDVHILQVDFSLRENGQVFVNIPFSAKNDFGATVEMLAVCHVWEGHPTRINIRNP